MPRLPRIDHPLARHHVMVRGIERRPIFRDDEDRARFLRRLARVLAETGARLLAFALMTNHFHLLIETRGVPLSRVMARLGTGHALDFNRRHRRVGHLYQNRYKSKLLDSEDAFRAVLRYIHLNPLKAGIVPDLAALARWPWTGHAALLGHLDCPFLEAREALRRFGDDPAEARRNYALWMAREDDAEAAPEPPPSGPLPVLGAPDDFVDPTRLDPRDGQEALRRAGWGLERVMNLVCARLGADAAALREGRRTAQVSRARETVAWLAVRRLGLRQVEVARATGVTPQAMPVVLARAEAREEELRGAFPELVDF